MFSFGLQTRVTSHKHVINCKLNSCTLREPTGREYHRLSDKILSLRMDLTTYT